MPISNYLIGGGLGALGGAAGGYLSSSSVRSPSDVWAPTGIGALTGAGVGLLGARLSKSKLEQIGSALRESVNEASFSRRQSAANRAHAEKGQLIVDELRPSILKRESSLPVLEEGLAKFEDRLTNAQLVGSPKTIAKAKINYDLAKQVVDKERRLLKEERDEAFRISKGVRGLLEEARNLDKAYEEARQATAKNLKSDILTRVLYSGVPSALSGFAAGSLASQKEKAAAFTVNPSLKSRLQGILDKARTQLVETYRGPGTVAGATMGATTGASAEGLFSDDSGYPYKGLLAGAIGGAILGGPVGRYVRERGNKWRIQQEFDLLSGQYGQTMKRQSEEIRAREAALEAVKKKREDLIAHLNDLSAKIKEESPDPELGPLLNLEHEQKSRLLKGLDSSIRNDMADIENIRLSRQRMQSQVDRDIAELESKVFINEAVGGLAAGAVGGSLAGAAVAPKEKTSAMKDLAISAGKGALMGLGVAAGGALVNAAISKAKDIRQDMNKATYYKNMLDANPTLQSEDVNPTEVQRHFDTLFKFNPEYASDPVVSGSYVRNALDYARPSLETVNNIVNARRNIVQTRRDEGGGGSPRLQEAALKNVMSNAPEYVEMMGWS
jgi:hypothetical protein